jgi:uncharacterized lipoprotein YddW (UPF0748 family)
VAGCGSSAKGATKPAASPPVAASLPSSLLTTAIPDEEVRGIFVSTAYNLDWPSQPGLPPNVQENEIDAIIARAADLNCNTIFLQVSAFGDRIYRKTGPTTKQSWSKSVNNFNDPGDATHPDYDPLAVWIAKAHENQMQLIAWINPFRTDWPLFGTDNKKLPFFVSVVNGEHLYLDPTSERVQAFALGVVRDLLDNYKNSPKPPRRVFPVAPKMAPQPRGQIPMKMSTAALSGAPAAGQSAAASQPGGSGGEGDDDDGLDGVVVDHYFPDPNDPGQVMAEPHGPILAMTAGAPADDGTTTAPATKELTPGQKRAEWLRKKYEMPEKYQPANEATVDDFVRNLYALVKEKKRILALSPSINKPTQIAHAKTWLHEGLCHYFIPEIYVHPAAFGPSLDGWMRLNDGPDPKPLIVPALNGAAVEKADRHNQLWLASEIEQETDIARSRGVGQAFYSWRALREHKHGGPPEPNSIGEHLRTGQYREKSLAPESKPPLLDALPQPSVEKGSPGFANVSMPKDSPKIRFWAFKVFGEHGWSGWQTASGIETTLPTNEGTKIRVRAVDRHNRKSPVKEIDL